MSFLSFLRISAFVNPESAKVAAMAVKTSTMAIKPKSAGSKILARTIPTTKETP